MRVCMKARLHKIKCLSLPSILVQDVRSTRFVCHFFRVEACLRLHAVSTRNTCGFGGSVKKRILFKIKIHVHFSSMRN